MTIARQFVNELKEDKRLIGYERAQLLTIRKVLRYEDSHRGHFRPRD